MAGLWITSLFELELVTFKLFDFSWFEFVNFNCCGWVGIPGPVPPWLAACCLSLLSDISQHQISVVGIVLILILLFEHTGFVCRFCISRSWCLAFVFEWLWGKLNSRGGCRGGNGFYTDSTRILHGFYADSDGIRRILDGFYTDSTRILRGFRSESVAKHTDSGPDGFYADSTRILRGFHGFRNPQAFQLSVFAIKIYKLLKFQTLRIPKTDLWLKTSNYKPGGFHMS